MRITLLHGCLGLMVSGFGSTIAGADIHAIPGGSGLDALAQSSIPPPFRATLPSDAVAVINGDSRPVSAMAFTPDGRTLILAHESGPKKGEQPGTIEVWELSHAVLPMSLLARAGVLLEQRVKAQKPPVVQPADPGQPPAADDQVTLEWKFEKDKLFYQEMTTRTRQDIKFKNGQGVYPREQTLYFSWRPVGRDKDGNWVLKQVVEAVRFAFEVDGKKTYEYDSRKDPGGVPTMLADYCHAFVGSEFTVNFGKDGKVQKVEGRDDLMKKLATRNPALETIDPEVLSDAALRQAAEILLNPLNPKPVRRGDSWTWNQTLDCRPIGKIESRYRFRYDRLEGKNIRIEVQSTQELKGKGTELKGKGTGTILFDHDKGRIASVELELPLKGKIDVVSHGMYLISPRDPALLVNDEAELTQSQKITIKTSETKPVQ